MSIGLTAFTLFHVAISLVAIASGIVAAFAMISGRRLDGWTAVFLATTVATSVTGFFFPVHHFTPAHALGIISLLILPIAIFARYVRHLSGAWRWLYVASAMLALYLNVFVLLVQSFLKVPALRALAPTQTEPAFKFSQLFVLLLFVALTALAVVRFHPQPRLAPAPALQPA